MPRTQSNSASKKTTVHHTLGVDDNELALLDKELVREREICDGLFDLVARILSPREAKAAQVKSEASRRETFARELSEALRWRELTWSLIPPLSRKLVLPYLTVKETLRLDVAVTETGDEKNLKDRDHLVKAYKGLRSAGFDEWVYKGRNCFEGVRWARKRGVDLQNLKLEYKGKRDADQVLGQLVVDEDEDMATYYAARSEARDTDVSIVAGNHYRYDEYHDSTTLIEAVRLGYVEVAKCLLDRGADVNDADHEGRTPLYWASHTGHMEVVKTLLEAKAEVDKANIYGQTPLYQASHNGHVEVVKTLLAAKADMDKANYKGETPLWWASHKGHVEVVEAFLAAEVDVSKADVESETPLYWASRNGHLEVVKVLLAAEAEVNKANSKGETPLWWASRNGHMEVVKTLLAAKADMDKANYKGETPLHQASYKGHVEVVSVLLAAKADVDKADNVGWTPLQWASYKGHVEVVKTLLAAEVGGQGQ